ncbi:acyltransferase 3 [Parachaetomium inaequale]|uniref:Acyltransferase 3 n=1 Tax=Parachaetomium inaequale TaxID=2588326 RepID=A0AAN6PQD6_9PEZI|nr:acyltransferase 3 [Parachaetomium inaequale]
MKSITFRGLRHLLWPRGTGSSDGPRQLRPTAYLDGLRGFAAFLVYIHHHELFAHGLKEMKVFESGFGYEGEFHLATFFLLRNFFTGGHLAVAIFFVISGYVLSVKPLSLIHAGEHLKLFDNLASAFFRRWFRLYIPLIVTTLVYVTTLSVFGIWHVQYEVKETLGGELWNWYIEFKNFSNIFKEGWLSVSYNGHLWSIPLEMRGSIITFTACIALARATHKARLLCLLALVYYFIYIVDAYYCALFMAGMLQCDLDLLAKRDGYFPPWLRRLEPYKTFIFYHLFLIGMYLGGVPSYSQDLNELRASPGWYYLSYLKPQAVFDFKWFYLFLAGNMLVACVPRIAWQRRFFESRFCQFLGRVSFALYLVHGPILYTLGDRVYYAVGWHRPAGELHYAPIAHWGHVLPLPQTGPLGLEIALLLPQLVLLPLTLWVADLVTRMVDEPAVRFAAWMYKRVQQDGEAEPKPVVLAPLTRVD